MIALSLFLAVVTTPVETSKFVVVDLRAQKLYAFQDMEKVMELNVSTGKPGLDTPVGVIKVQRKDLTGTSINGEKLEYLVRIYAYDSRMKMRRRINIHEYKSVPAKPASLGCVRTKVGEGRKLYNWIEVGTPVHIVKDTASDCWL